MAKWQPPIPAGALWSAEAVKLGPALALLAWCYDAVQRDGTFSISLADAAGDLDTEYRTVKRWWSDLRAGPFFAEVTDKGKRGFVVKFASLWIDWRVLNARQTNNFQGPYLALEEGTPADNDVQGPVKAPSRPDEGTDMALNTPAYKVLNTHISEGVTAAADAAPSRPTRKAREAKPDVTPEPIRQAIADACAAESGRMLARVNKAAKAIWSRQQANGKTVEQTVAAVPLVVGFLRRSVYPFTEGQPLTPEAFDDRWAQAAEDEKARRRALVELTVPATPAPAADAPKRMTPAESAARLRELDAAKRNGVRHEP